MWPSSPGEAAASAAGIALTLAGEGMRVVVADIEPDAAAAVATEIADAGGEASAETLDVTDPAAVEALAARCDEQHGGVDVLCNNAGVIGPTPIGTGQPRQLALDRRRQHPRRRAT